MLEVSTTGIKTRAGNARCCECCGQRLQPKRSSRRQRYCNDACRQSAYRSKKWADRYEIPDPLRSVENNRIKSNACNGHFDGRPPCICGPGTVIEAEVFGRRKWRAVISPDGVSVQVTTIKQIGPVS